MARARQEQQEGYRASVRLRSVNCFALRFLGIAQRGGLSLYRITYTSHSSRLFNRNSLTAITSVSRRNNIKREITGLLVYCDRRFFQVLEGEEAVLSHLMSRLLADPRHRGLSMVEHGPVEQRAFTTWRLCCPSQDAPVQSSVPSSPLAELIPVNSDLRGNDPRVRQHVRKFLAGIGELSAVATG